MVSNRERAIAAVNAMKDLGFTKKQAARVLKELLKLYENNWEPIEDENYRVLAEAILDSQEPGNQRQELQDDDMGEVVKMPSQEEIVPSSMNDYASGASAPSSSRRRRLDHSSRTYDDMDDLEDTETDAPLVKRPRRKQPEPASNLDQAIVPVPQEPSSYAPSTSEGTRIVTESGEVITFRKVVSKRRSSAVPLKEPKEEPDTLPAFGDASLAVSRPASNIAGKRVCDNQESLQGLEHQTPQTPAAQAPAVCTSKARNPMSTRNIAKNKTIVPCTNNSVVQEESSSTKLEIASSTNGMSSNYISANANGSTDDVDNAVAVAQNHLALNVFRPAHDPTDIARGEEKFSVPVFNDYTSEETPSSFGYIPQNLVRENAYLNICLARIGDENCCADCFGDCLAAPVPCVCTRETGGEFAYTSEGLVRREFLDECLEIVQNRWDPQHRTYCEGECPIERSEDGTGKCKGHLVRKFIKECWTKCGCRKGCGNRVVQRGITCQLQVFMTGDGRGWGLRTLDEIPKGTFICEYAGEILTAKEYQERYGKSKDNLMKSQPALLDADWAPRVGLKDEEAFCLDATFYGNVARFINHRCYDANLVEVPVEIETPDHLYYHLALFSSRKIEALEELTWDYGIDFNEKNRSFKCTCGSIYCRDTKRSRKGRGRQ